MDETDLNTKKVLRRRIRRALLRFGTGIYESNFEYAGHAWTIFKKNDGRIFLHEKPADKNHIVQTHPVPKLGEDELVELVNQIAVNNVMSL